MTFISESPTIRVFTTVHSCQSIIFHRLYAEESIENSNACNPTRVALLICRINTVMYWSTLNMHESMNLDLSPQRMDIYLEVMSS